mmetsp:Transcript_20844/g.69579  ORF Transcript_20844/g.69579 Transcript_20844/m.69579 type:complete len:587 (-) Transcript_20844:110-1870(-)
MKARTVVVVSILAGMASVFSVWTEWRTKAIKLGSPNTDLRVIFSLQFWEILLDSYPHKLIMLNFGCNLLYLVGKVLQLLLLGQLRELEAAKISDRVRTYVLVKFIFMGAILQDHDEKEMMVWFVWLALVGFLKQLGLLARDRLEFMMLSVQTKSVDYARLGLLIAFVLTCDAVLMRCCLMIFGCWPSKCEAGGFGVTLLLLFECVLIIVDSAQTIIRFCIHMINLSRDGHWEQRSLYSFYTEAAAELINNFLSLFHYGHVWMIHGMSVTFTDAMLFLLTRSIVNSIRSKFSSLSAFLNIDKRFHDATSEELAQVDDKCSICWETMSKAKVLPCGHAFHLVCLRGWIEHSATCPNCRRSISGDSSAEERQNNMQDGRAEDGNNAGLQEEGFRNGGANLPGQRRRWSILRWLSMNENGRQGGNQRRGFLPFLRDVSLQADEIPQEIVQSVLNVMPNLSPRAVRQDLIRTMDVQVTVNRGLEGLIAEASSPMPPPSQQRPRPPQEADGERDAGPQRSEDEISQEEDLRRQGSESQGRDVRAAAAAAAAAAAEAAEQQQPLSSSSGSSGSRSSSAQGCCRAVIGGSGKGT